MISLKKIVKGVYFTLYLSFLKQGCNTLSKLKISIYVKKIILFIWKNKENQWFKSCHMRIINAQYIFYLLIMQWRWYRYMIEILVIIFEMWRCTYKIITTDTVQRYGAQRYVQKTMYSILYFCHYDFFLHLCGFYQSYWYFCICLHIIIYSYDIMLEQMWNKPCISDVTPPPSTPRHITRL